MNTLHNKQYEDFVLSEIVRPYQNMLGLEQRVKTLSYGGPVDVETDISYHALRTLANIYPEWFAKVIDRLVRIYSEIDFSFFPNEQFAWDIRNALETRGVKYNNPFKSLPL